jgi:hypothetical protein
MRKLVLLVLVTVVGCKSSPANPDAPQGVIDAGRDCCVGDTCDPVTQTGCNPGQKCAWTRTGASQAGAFGIIECVPDGTAAVGGACAYGTSGVTTGYDDCEHGLACVAPTDVDQAQGTCAAICDVTGATDACGTNFACEKHVGYFENIGDPVTNDGLCDPTCDPRTNQRDDGVADCGGTIVDGVSTMGCYGLPSSGSDPTAFTCKPVLAPTKTSDAYAYDATLGVHENSCAPGFMPLLYDSTADLVAHDETKLICVAVCTPAPTSLESHATPGGVAPHDCASAGATGTHECRYWWYLEPSFARAGRWTDAMGYCVDYTKYTYDGSPLHPPTSATTPLPSCTTLSSSARTIDAVTAGGAQMVSDAQYWGCVPK